MGTTSSSITPLDSIDDNVINNLALKYTPTFIEKENFGYALICGSHETNGEIEYHIVHKVNLSIRDKITEKRHLFRVSKDDCEFIQYIVNYFNQDTKELGIYSIVSQATKRYDNNGNEINTVYLKISCGDILFNAFKNYPSYYTAIAHFLIKQNNPEYYTLFPRSNLYPLISLPGSETGSIQQIQEQSLQLPIPLPSLHIPQYVPKSIQSAYQTPYTALAYKNHTPLSSGNHEICRNSYSNKYNIDGPLHSHKTYATPTSTLSHTEYQSSRGHEHETQKLCSPYLKMLYTTSTTSYNKETNASSVDSSIYKRSDVDQSDSTSYFSGMFKK